MSFVLWFRSQWAYIVRASGDSEPPELATAVTFKGVQMRFVAFNPAKTGIILACDSDSSHLLHSYTVSLVKNGTGYEFVEDVSFLRDLLEPAP